MLLLTTKGYSDLYGSLVTMFGLFAIIGLFIKLMLKTNKKEMQKFHENERTANLVDHKPLPDDLIFKLDISKVSLDILLTTKFDEETLSRLDGFRHRISRFDEQLCVYPDDAVSNMDIKMEYGPMSLQQYIQYEQNFIAFTKILIELSNFLIHKELSSHAIPVLQYLVELRCTISAPYITLAEILYENQEKDALLRLKNDIENNNIFKDNAFGEKKVLEKINYFLKTLM